MLLSDIWTLQAVEGLLSIHYTMCFNSYCFLIFIYLFRSFGVPHNIYFPRVMDQCASNRYTHTHLDTSIYSGVWKWIREGEELLFFDCNQSPSHSNDWYVMWWVCVWLVSVVLKYQNKSTRAFVWGLVTLGRSDMIFHCQTSFLSIPKILSQLSRILE